MPDVVERVETAEHLDPVAHVRVETEEQARAIADCFSTDTIEKLNAGNQLVYALYHRDAEWWKDQPRSVMKAYMRACAAYGVNQGKNT